MDRRRLLLALAIAVLAPALAWVAWISRAGEGASDAQHVGWFATVAVGALVAGVAAPRGTRSQLALWPTATAAALVTLFWWWSAYDVTGLFVVGIVIATPFLVGGSMALVAAGQSLPRPGRRAAPAAPGR